MREAIPRLPAVFDPIELAAASAALYGQFGEVSAEAYRRAALREMLGQAHVLGQALENYVRGARLHFRGVHCTADMQTETTALSCALLAWCESVNRAADAYQNWQERRTLAEPSAYDHTDASAFFPFEGSGSVGSIEISRMDERS